MSNNTRTTFCDWNYVGLTADFHGSITWNTSEKTTSITVSTAGDYSYTSIDANGCSVSSSTVSVVVNSNPTPTISALGNTTFCDGGSVDLDAGFGYANYSWSNGETTQGITSTANNTYSVTVTDANGCTGTSGTTSVVVNPNPSPTITPSGNTSFCDGGSLNLDAGAGYANYNWSSGETSQSMISTSSNTYFVTLTYS